MTEQEANTELQTRLEKWNGKASIKPSILRCEDCADHFLLGYSGWRRMLLRDKRVRCSKCLVISKFGTKEEIAKRSREANKVRLERARRAAGVQERAPASFDKGAWRRSRYASDEDYRNKVKERALRRYQLVRGTAEFQGKKLAGERNRRASRTAERVTNDRERGCIAAFKRNPKRQREWSGSPDWSKLNGVLISNKRHNDSLAIKQETMMVYGNGSCKECGITDLQVLTLDHIHEDGSADRHLVGKTLYQSLKRRGYPDRDRFQVLCSNHNFKKHLSSCGKESRDIKIRAIRAYSPTCSCVSCQETDIDVLTIDHVKNDGGVHRRSLGNSSLLYWLARSGYPDGFQVMCFNCNIKKSRKKPLTRGMSGDFDGEKYDFEFVTSSCVKGFLNQHHYIGMGRAGATIKVTKGNTMVACAVFNAPIRQNSDCMFGFRDYLELGRFCSVNRSKNFSSWALSRCLRLIKQSTKLVVTYADTTVGHTGVLYQACNFKFHHEVKPDYWYTGNGIAVFHKKTLYNRATRAGMTEREFADRFGFEKVFGGKKLCYTIEC